MSGYLDPSVPLATPDRPAPVKKQKTATIFVFTLRRKYAEARGNEFKRCRSRHRLRERRTSYSKLTPKCNGPMHSGDFGLCFATWLIAC